MKKKLIGCIVAATMFAGVAIPTTVAFADGTTPVTTGTSTNQNTDGPVFHVANKNLLVKVGENLNLKNALNVTITDPYSQNLQDQITNYPNIDTAKPGKYNFTMKVTDSKGLSASETVTINVIGAKTDATLSTISPESLTQKELTGLIEGNTDGLKLSYANYNGTNDTFDLVVSNGTQKLSFPITMKQGTLSPLLSNSQKTVAKEHATPVAGQTSTTVAGDTAGTKVTNGTTPVAGSTSLTTDGQTIKKDLPKTGGMETLPYVLGGLVVVAIAAVGAFMVKNKQKKFKDGFGL